MAENIHLWHSDRGTYFDRNVNIISWSDDYHIYLGKYHYGTKELQLSTALFNELEGVFNDEMEYVIDWFNNEFNLNAEYVTY